MNKYYATIPVELCQFALVNRKVNQVKLFVYLKFISGGHIKYNIDFFDYSKEWANEVDIHYKTVKNSLQWLIKNKWITVNSKRKSLRIIGYKQLSKKLKFTTKTAIIFEPETFSDFKAFSCAAVIAYYRNKKRWFDRQSASNKGDVSKNCKTANSSFYPLPSQYLASCLGVCKVTAHNYKIEAAKHNYIVKKANTTFIKDINGNHIKNECYDALKIGGSNYVNVKRLRKGKTYLKFVDADLIKLNVILKKKRLK